MITFNLAPGYRGYKIWTVGKSEKLVGIVSYSPTDKQYDFSPHQGVYLTGDELILIGEFLKNRTEEIKA